MYKTLILTVGTGKTGEDVAEAILHSIAEQNPSSVFLCASKKTAETTVPFIKRKINDGIELNVEEEEEINDVEKLFFRYSALIEKAIQITKSPARVTADYTSGTKAMSAAMVLAAVNANISRVTYVYGERDKEGRVMAGTERLMSLTMNKVYTGKQIEFAVQAFKQHQFLIATDTLEKIDSKKANVYMAKIDELKKIIKAYQAWDLFHHQAAAGHLSEIFPGLIVKKTLENHKQFLYFLLKEKNDDNNFAKMLDDLYYNASRRAEEGKWDDAVARLYRLLEMIGQNDFFQKFKCTTSEVHLDKIPSHLHKLFNEITREGDGTYKIGLMMVIEVLKEDGTQWAVRLWAEKDNLKKMLHKRNHSILAHGHEPLGQTKFESFRDFIVTYWQPENEIKFPELKL